METKSEPNTVSTTDHSELHAALLGDYYTPGDASARIESDLVIESAACAGISVTDAARCALIDYMGELQGE